MPSPRPPVHVGMKSPLDESHVGRTEVHLKRQRSPGRRRLQGSLDAESVSQATREDIVRAAAEEFANVGFEAASIEAIAARTQVSKRMVYYHFGGKPELYAAVLEAAYTQVRRVDQGPAPSSASPMQALRQYAEEAAVNFMRNPSFVRLMLFENLSGAAVVRHSPAIKAISRNNLASMKAILKLGQRCGEMRRDIRAMDVFLTIVALSFHAVSNRATVQATLDVDMLAPREATRRQQLVGELVCRYVATRP